MKRVAIDFSICQDSRGTTFIRCSLTTTASVGNLDDVPVARLRGLPASSTLTQLYQMISSRSFRGLFHSQQTYGLSTSRPLSACHQDCYSSLQCLYFIQLFACWGSYIMPKLVCQPPNLLGSPFGNFIQFGAECGPSASPVLQWSPVLSAATNSCNL